MSIPEVKAKYIIGIDPGLSGALAVLDINTKKVVDIYDIPTYKTKSRARKRGYLIHMDIKGLATMLDLYAKDTVFAVLEEPGAAPKQGLGSTFIFGHTCGAIHGVLVGLNIDVAPVKPAAWKPAMGLGRDKNAATAMAKELYPETKHYIKLKKHHDRAEAVLLAHFGAKYLKT